MTLPEALAESCDTYFYEIGNRFYERRLRGPRAHAAVGAPLRLRRSRRGSTSAARPTASLPTPDWRKKTFESDWDRAWNPGDSIQLSIGQKDLLVTPLQMAAFYAMLANGGKRRHAVPRVGRRAAGREGLAARRPAPVRADAAEVGGRRSGRARGGPRRALPRDALRERHVVGRLRQLLGARSRARPGTAEKVVPLPGYPTDHLEDQSWWCGWGPSDDAQLVVCALIENGGHGSTAAAPAALKVFERFFDDDAAEPAALVRRTD